MARCRCAEGACGCSVVAGTNTTVDGTGTPKDPFVVSAGDHGYLDVADTPTLDLVLLGDGSSANPHLLSGNVLSTPLPDFVDTAEVAFTVTATTPPEVSAELPLLVFTGGQPGWVFVQQADGTFSPQPPPTAVPPGAVMAGFGLTGDGSPLAPMRIDLCSYDDLKAACAP